MNNITKYARIVGISLLSILGAWKADKMWTNITRKIRNSDKALCTSKNSGSALQDSLNSEGALINSRNMDDTLKDSSRV